MSQNNFGPRALNQEERAFLNSLFNVGGVQDLDLDLVTVDVGSFWGIFTDGFTPGNQINFRTGSFPSDPNTPRSGAQLAFLAHEAAHVWQSQQGRLFPDAAVQQAGAFLSLGLYDPYDISDGGASSFWSYNVEQQAEIVRSIARWQLGSLVGAAVPITNTVTLDRLYDEMLSGPQ